MSTWYFHVPGQADRLGPFDDASARQYAAQYPHAQVWRAGMSGWMPLAQVPDLAPAGGPPPMPGMPPVPPATVPGSHHAAPGRRNDDIDFAIHGQEMQFVEIELDPGESAIAEAGALMFKDSSVQMDTVFGDGSHTGQGKAKVAFAAPYPGTVIPMKLDQLGGKLICQKDSFLAGARGVQVGVHFQRKVMTGLFGGEGFIMQKLEGDGWVFVHAGGCVIERELRAGERLDVDTGCVVAYTAGVDMDVKRVPGIKSMIFGGEGVFLATLTGPGKVWLQSLPFSRLAGRVFAAAPQGGGQSRGEGSVLGGLGRLLDGDNNF